MNELTIFNNEEFGEIRTVEIDGEPWFVGKDIAQALGYSNTSDAILKHVDEEDKGVAKCDTLGGTQNLTVINESGVYALVFGSKLESAKKFKHWITSEVLPQIRKTGSYAMAKSPTELMVLMAQELDKQAKAVEEVKADMKRLEAKITTIPSEYYTIAGYANLKGKKIDVTRANQLGRYAANLSRKYGYDIGRVSDPRYGSVNSYHMDVLRDVFRGIK
ncbi:MAG: Bro-N domain-containing protein [Clostridiales bacterium]|nr:Bro-N domain-containing protein [Clostridiales bacterium]